MRQRRGGRDCNSRFEKLTSINGHCLLLLASQRRKGRSGLAGFSFRCDGMRWRLVDRGRRQRRSQALTGRRHCDARSLSPSHCLMPIAPNLGSRWREHDANLPRNLRARQSKSAFLCKTAARLNRRRHRGRVMLQCTRSEETTPCCPTTFDSIERPVVPLRQLTVVKLTLVQFQNSVGYYGIPLVGQADEHCPTSVARAGRTCSGGPSNEHGIVAAPIHARRWRRYCRYNARCARLRRYRSRLRGDHSSVEAREPNRNPQHLSLLFGRLRRHHVLEGRSEKG